MKYLTHAINQNSELSRAKSCLVAVQVHCYQNLDHKRKGSKERSQLIHLSLYSVELNSLCGASGIIRDNESTFSPLRLMQDLLLTSLILHFHVLNKA